MLAVPIRDPAPVPLTRQEAAYRHAYQAVARRYGRRTPGRYLLAHHHTPGQLRASLLILNRMLHPTPTPARTPTTALTQPVTSAASFTLPNCTWQHESGGDWTAVNPSSGAYGRYQILPSTSAAYGCNLSTDAGQTACAETIYQHQGAGAWVGCSA